MKKLLLLLSLFISVNAFAGIPLTSNFTMNAALPIEDRMAVADLTARDALSSLRRWEGMIVYVVSEGKHFTLAGGITNGDWGEVAGGGGISDWLTATDYIIGNVVIDSNRIYQALSDHTSGVFVVDLAALKWKEISGTDPSPTLVAPILGNATGTSLALGGTKAASAVLDVQSTTQGVLPPRMTTAQMLAIATPATGLTIYNTDVNSLASWNGTTWVYGFGNLSIATEWTSYTPTVTGLGTISPASNFAKYRIVNGDLLVEAAFVMGTTTGSLVSISLPAGLSIDASRVPIANTTANQGANVGKWVQNNTGQFGSVITAVSTSTTLVYTGSYSTATGALTPQAGSSWTSSLPATISFRVPLSGYSSNTSAWVQANSNPIATTTEFSAAVSSAGVVSGENVDWINGNCSVVSTSQYPCVFNSGIFTSAPNCTLTQNNASDAMAFIFTPATISGVTIRTTNASTTASLASSFVINCQRSTTDYTAAHSPFIIGTFEAIGNIATLSEVQPSGTDAGSSSVGTVARVLNTKVDPNGIVTSLVSNQFTLPAGRYYIDASAPVLGAVQHKIRIRNITDSITAIYGTSSFAASTNLTESKALLSGEVTITAPKTFELQHYIATGRAVSGLGTATFSGDVEVYSIVKIQRLR